MANISNTSDIGISQAELDKLFSGTHKDFSSKLRKFESVNEFADYIRDPQIQKDLHDCIHHGIEDKPLKFVPVTLPLEKFREIITKIEEVEKKPAKRVNLPMFAFGHCYSCKSSYSHKKLEPLLINKKSIDNTVRCPHCKETFVPYIFMEINNQVFYTMLLSPYRTTKGIEYVYETKYGKAVLTRNEHNIYEDGTVKLDVERGELFRYPILVLNLLYYMSDDNAKQWITFKHPQDLLLFDGKYPLHSLM